MLSSEITMHTVALPSAKRSQVHFRRLILDTMYADEHRTLPSRSKRHRRWQNRDIPQSPLGALEELHYLITERLLASVTNWPGKKERPWIGVAPPLVRLL